MAASLRATVGIEQLIPFGRGRQSLKESVWYSGHLLTFLATGKDTQGRFALIEIVGRKGNVPPPHIHHREDETFYILEGEITASVGGQTIKGTPGTMIFLPRNVLHSFEIDSEQGRMLVLLTPAGLEGYFKECSVPARAMTAQDDFEGVLSTLTEDVEHDVVGSPGSQLTGRDAARGYYQSLLRDLKGESVVPVKRLYGENFTIDETIWTGRAVGRPFGVPGDEGRVTFRILHVLEFRGDKISRENVWVDAASLMQQLKGNRKGLP